MENTITIPNSSVLTIKNGEVFIIFQGKLFPKSGGAECGTTWGEFNLSQHIRELIRGQLKD